MYEINIYNISGVRNYVNNPNRRVVMTNYVCMWFKNEKLIDEAAVCDPLLKRKVIEMFLRRLVTDNKCWKNNFLHLDFLQCGWTRLLSVSSLDLPLAIKLIFIHFLDCMGWHHNVGLKILNCLCFVGITLFINGVP